MGGQLQAGQFQLGLIPKSQSQSVCDMDIPEGLRKSVQQACERIAGTISDSAQAIQSAAATVETKVGPPARQGAQAMTNVVGPPVSSAANAIANGVSQVATKAAEVSQKTMRGIYLLDWTELPKPVQNGLVNLAAGTMANAPADYTPSAEGYAIHKVPVGTLFGKVSFLGQDWDYDLIVYRNTNSITKSLPAGIQITTDL